jgi:hypothetical protein
MGAKVLFFVGIHTIICIFAVKLQIVQIVQITIDSTGYNRL